MRTARRALWASPRRLCPSASSICWPIIARLRSEMTISDPSLSLQKTIRERLIGSPELMALVQADHVMDANGRPEIMPAIYIGEGQTVFRRWDATTYATLHVWFAEPGLVQCKEAVSAVVAALRIDAQADGVLPI